MNGIGKIFSIFHFNYLTWSDRKIMPDDVDLDDLCLFDDVSSNVHGVIGAQDSLPALRNFINNLIAFMNSFVTDSAVFIKANTMNPHILVVSKY